MWEERAAAGFVCGNRAPAAHARRARRRKRTVFVKVSPSAPQPMEKQKPPEAAQWAPRPRHHPIARPAQGEGARRGIGGGAGGVGGYWAASFEGRFGARR